MHATTVTDEEVRLLEAASWASVTGPFAAFGRRFVVETDDRRLGELVEELYADLRVTADTSVGDPQPIARFRVLTRAPGGRSLVLRDDRVLGRRRTSAATMSSLVWGVNRWILDAASGEHLLLHAGGVAAADGRALALIAPSESGKSTLTLGLLDRGYGYLSDEALALHDDAIVHGYPKPVSIDRGSMPLFDQLRPSYQDERAQYVEAQWHIPARRVSSTVDRGRLVALVFPSYTPGQALSLRPVAGGEKLRRAVDSVFAPDNGARVPLAYVQQLARRVDGLPAYVLHSSDVAAACDLLAELLDHDGRLGARSGSS